MTKTSRRPDGITVKSRREIDLMRQAGLVVAKAKARLMEAVRPGITTGELDRLAEETIVKLGATPSFKGYAAGRMIPFPATICASVNNEIAQLDDGWTVVTADGSLSAHFEDTVAITADGGEVLTSPDGYSF